ncbi:hypothetical protein ACFYO0_14540 [Streptomyces sp. NPDC006365]|uniref:hypothetical protein n=1 Tax=Streptomyces sp. NPDC006365 TaxID=3364744 RepID=UPI0036861C91
MSAANWGDVPTWMAAIFAGGAALFAYLTIKSQREQIAEQRRFIAEQSANLALERSELRAAAEDRKWAQARQVFMYHRQEGTERDNEGNFVCYDHWIVLVENSSDAPIHQLEMRFGTAYIAAEVWELPRAPRGEDERCTYPLHLLGPKRRARFLSQRWSEATVHNNRPTLTFTDDSGVCWSLDSQGKLEEVPADGAS